jgi:hypothetical protein
MNNNKNYLSFSIIILLIIVVATTGYFIFKKGDYVSGTPTNSELVKTTPSQVLMWSKDDIRLNDEPLLDINEFPDEIQVSADAVFGSSNEITGVMLSPDNRWLAISITGGVHEFGWLYEIPTKTLSPVAFSFDGGVRVKKWNSNTEVVFEITSPKPATSDLVINVNKRPDYPRYKSSTGAQIRDELSKKGCPDQLIVNKMPGPGSQVKSSYYVKDGKRVEIAEFDPIWVKTNCDVPTEEVY